MERNFDGEGAMMVEIMEKLDDLRSTMGNCFTWLEVSFTRLEATFIARRQRERKRIQEERNSQMENLPSLTISTKNLTEEVASIAEIQQGKEDLPLFTGDDFDCDGMRVVKCGEAPMKTIGDVNSHRPLPEREKITAKVVGGYDAGQEVEKTVLHCLVPP